LLVGLTALSQFPALANLRRHCGVIATASDSLFTRKEPWGQSRAASATGAYACYVARLGLEAGLLICARAGGG